MWLKRPNAGAITIGLMFVGLLLAIHFNETGILTQAEGTKFLFSWLVTTGAVGALVMMVPWSKLVKKLRSKRG